MKKHLMLNITSLLSILLMTLHLTSDTIHAKVGTPEAGGSTLVGVPVLAVWLFGALALAERRSGHIIMLVGSLLALGMPGVHVMGAGGVFSGPSARSPGCSHSLRADGTFRRGCSYIGSRAHCSYLSTFSQAGSPLFSAP